MSQSCRPASNHSSSLARTAGCRPLPASQSRRSCSNSPSRKNRCSESRSTGVVPVTVEIGVLQVGRRVGGAAVLAGVAVLVRRCRRAGRCRARSGPAGTCPPARRRPGGRCAGDGAARRAALRTARRSSAGSPPSAWSGSGRSRCGSPRSRAGARRPMAAISCLGRDAVLARADHDRRAVAVLGADVEAVVAAHALEAHPDVGLHRLDDVAEVQRAVGVGQGAGDEDPAGVRSTHASFTASNRALLMRLLVGLAARR